MSHVSTVYSQLLQLIPRHEFQILVKRYEGDRYVKQFTCWRQFVTLLYAQIKKLDSLREILTSLNSHAGSHYHLGLKRAVRSTLSDANNRRDHRIYEELFYRILNKCQALTPPHSFRFENPLYSLDASIIELSLSVFPWADYNRTKGALKLHCLLDHRGNIPSFACVTLGRVQEISVVKEYGLPVSPDSIVVMDRGYQDFGFLYSLHSRGVYFVTRTRKNQQYDITGQHRKPAVKGLRDDLRVRTTGVDTRETYPEELRVVRWHDEESGKDLEFLTNNFRLAASTIAAIYKNRWQIEMFFKWIKQNLKIKSFLGTSLNAMLTQIWVAMCCYLLLSYIKFQTGYKYNLLSLTRILRETLMLRLSLLDLLTLDPERGIPEPLRFTHQLSLF